MKSYLIKVKFDVGPIQTSDLKLIKSWHKQIINRLLTVQGANNIEVRFVKCKNKS